MRFTPPAPAEVRGVRWSRRKPATAAAARMTPATSIRVLMGLGETTGCTALVTVVAPEASESAKATSWADWNRLRGSFSRQWRTT